MLFFGWILMAVSASEFSMYYVSCWLCGQTKEHTVVVAVMMMMMMMSCMEVCATIHNHTHTHGERATHTHTKTMVIVQLRFQWIADKRSSRAPISSEPYACMFFTHTHNDTKTRKHSTYYMHTIFTHHHKITWSLFIVKPRITWAGCHCNNTRIGNEQNKKRAKTQTHQPN